MRKEAQNPIASLISVPLQNNTNFGIQPSERTQDVLNIQPVIPIGVGENWNVIIRWITPIIWQPLPASPPAPEVGKLDKLIVKLGPSGLSPADQQAAQEKAIQQRD